MQSNRTVVLFVCVSIVALVLAYFAPGFSWDNDLVYGGF